MNAVKGVVRKGGGSDRLREVFEGLPPDARTTLLDFAEFLASRYPPATEPLGEPLDIPRPANESVVRAIKRLSTTYPMVDRSRLLNDTSMLMSQHILQGRAAKDVIDELEILFRLEYAKQRESSE